MKDRKFTEALARDGYQWDRGWHKEKVKKGKYGECI
jgi:hypothetical protein